MKYVRLFRRAARMRGASMTLVLALLYWALGLPLLFTTTSAAALLQYAATASSSAPSVSTSMIIRATTTNTIAAATTTRITFDPTGGNFGFGSLVAGDIFLSRFGGGLNQVANIGACSGTANEAYVTNITNGVSDFFDIVTCATDTIAPGQITINIANAHITNPASAPASYVIRWSSESGGGMDNGDTRVAIISTVTVTASVDTNLTFTITGVASTTAVNGTTTSTTTTATAIAFGVLSVGKSEFAAQRLNVSTNALNGFSVTVTQNNNLLSNNGADIDAFRDGNPTYPPTAWFNPAGTLGNENSYGHMGVTSDDSTLPGGDEYSSDFYAGLTSTSTRTVMYHSSVADGTTADIGQVNVGYRIAITALQEAATDYTNQLTYVCTPIF